MKVTVMKRYEKPMITVVKAEMQGICAGSEIPVSNDPATENACGKYNGNVLTGSKGLWDDEDWNEDDE